MATYGCVSSCSVFATITFLNVLLCAWMSVYMCLCVHLCVIMQGSRWVKIGSFLWSCGSQIWNSGDTWWQTPFPTSRSASYALASMFPPMLWLARSQWWCRLFSLQDPSTWRQHREVLVWVPCHGDQSWKGRSQDAGVPLEPSAGVFSQSGACTHSHS